MFFWINALFKHIKRCLPLQPSCTRLRLVNCWSAFSLSTCNETLVSLQVEKEQANMTGASLGFTCSISGP